jgi:putative membrane protein
MPPVASRLPAMLLGLYGLIWLGLAIAPVYRDDWMLENVLVVVALPVLVLAYRHRPFRDGTCVALFVFFVLHAIGAHYTYAEVPYDAWGRAVFGVSIDGWFGFERNHFDRLVHFLYGLLVTPAAIELIDAHASAKGAWRWLLVVSFMASQGSIYELLEWLAALVFGGELGMAYLGTQGDVWDGHKDMALALLGTVISASLLCRRAPRA